MVEDDEHEDWVCPKKSGHLLWDTVESFDYRD
jgi:hypothetical protein